MGTSTPFGGGSGKDPLIPSWLGGGEAGAHTSQAPAIPAASPAASGQVPNPASPPGAPPSPPGPQPPPGVPEFSPFDQRFRQPRTAFNKYARSGGSDKRNFAKAIASYVSRAGGGSKTAARRMASDKRAATRLGNILSQAGESGIREILPSLNLDALANRPIAEIYASLVDVICEPGGDLDQAFPRDAYLEAVAEIIELNPADLEKPSPETVAFIMERFIGNTIFDRILNAIGNGLITLPSSVSAVKDMDKSFREFVRGAVSDALNEIGRVFNSGQMKTVIDGVYDRSLAVLQVHAEAVAGGTL
jgi:hypothetical protein